MVTQVAKWGNSLGVRLPKPFADEIGLRDGATVELKVVHGQIVIAPAQPRYRLVDLLNQVKKTTLHSAIDSGPSVGREEW